MPSDPYRQADPPTVSIYPSYTGVNAICKKCENKHCFSAVHSLYSVRDNLIRRTCGNCNYAWSEAPLDGTPPIISGK